MRRSCSLVLVLGGLVFAAVVLLRAPKPSSIQEDVSWLRGWDFTNVNNGEHESNSEDRADHTNEGNEEYSGERSSSESSPQDASSQVHNNNPLNTQDKYRKEEASYKEGDGDLRQNNFRTSQNSWDATSNSKAQILAGRARFTVLTPHLIRLEYRAEDGSFNDLASLAVVHRKLDVPEFTTNEENGILSIETSALTLNYRLNTTFAKDNLWMKWKEGIDKVPDKEGHSNPIWRFGQANDGQLHGTIRSLDLLGPIDLSCQGPAGSKEMHNESLHCTEGVISRSGWTVVDDSETPVLDAKTGWWQTRSGGQDLYLFAHGLNYKAALGDFIKIAGAPPMLPKFALGTWWTRWYDYDEQELQSVIAKFKSFSFPLDVLVLDMNFHSKEAWGGYSWDRTAFPYPRETMSSLKKAYGLKIMANLHDDNGVDVYEDQFEAMAKYMGLEDPTEGIPFASCSDSKYAYGLEDIVLGALEKDGLDYWWTDWQQGAQEGGCTGGAHNPTIWLNHLRSTRSIRRGQQTRELTLGRWGGLGNHRYPVGFSGDVDNLSWDRLAYQPYFTVTASNVAYGLWSHDITGPHGDPELFVRWVQWGANSPIMRFHDRGMSAGDCNKDYPNTEISDDCAIGYPWQVPSRYFAAVRSTLIHRMRLLPYTYTLHREFHETGIAALRPVYYNHPDEPMAYEACTIDGQRSEFFLGDTLLVAPVVHAASRETGFLAAQEVWLPPGQWVELGSNRRLEGPANLTILADLEEIPTFIRAGGVLPIQSTSGESPLGSIGRQENYEHLIFTVFLDYSVSMGSAHVYNDDGTTRAYMDNKGFCYTFKYNFVNLKFHAELTVQCGPCSKPSSADSCTIPPLKHVEVHLPAAYPMQGAHSFRGSDQTSIFQLSDPRDGPVKLDVSGIELVDLPLKGMLASCRAAKRELDPARIVPGSEAKEEDDFLRHCASFSDVLSHSKSNFTVALSMMTQVFYPGAMQQVNRQTGNRWTFAQQVLARYPWHEYATVITKPEYDEDSEI
mmetsp:Transcript_15734/g.27677  ORF Transcript_15734/g.27677 Transcript_15734/m.27677 type:complete len:1010 (-) Transcript_15734:197-3226(-)